MWLKISLNRRAGRFFQVHRRYVVEETPQGVRVLDPHALHERILFEEILARIAAEPLESQRFLFPQVVTAGPLALDALSLPWLGATFRSRASGLPANALALEVLGLSSLPAPLPLAAILPQGGAGCTLTTMPDLLNVHVPVNGQLELALPLPNTIAFAGLALHQQVAALELGPGLDILALTSSNSLSLVKGSF